MVTEISIGEEDFQQLQAQEGVAITFCLKEFRVRFFPCPPCPSHALTAPPRASLLCLSFPGAPELRRVSKLVS